MKRQPVILNGQRVGRLRGSWLLFKETFRFLRADPEMLTVPIITSVINIVLFGLLVMAFVTGIIGSGGTDELSEQSLAVLDYVFIFGCYLIGAFTLSVNDGWIAHMVSVRARGENAKLGQSFGVVWRAIGTLFVWSLITSTVGLILRSIAERSQLLGRIVIALLGAAWAILTYFTVPAIILEGKSATEAISRSGNVFKQTWGETFVSNISIGLLFFFLYLVLILAGFGFLINATSTLEVTVLVVLGFMLFFSTIVVQQTLQTILKTLLFLYATQEEPPVGVDLSLLDQSLAKSPQADSKTPPAQFPPASTSFAPQSMQ